MNKINKFFRKNGSTILTVVGSAGTVITVALAIDSTVKAVRLLNEAKDKKGEELTKKETIMFAWKSYIPTIISWSITIGCIAGSKYIDYKSQAALSVAYGVLSNSYQEYKEKVNENLSKKDNEKIDREIIEKRYQDYTPKNKEGETLFFDYESMRFFESTLDNVLAAESQFIHNYKINGYAALNEYYDCLGIEHTTYGYSLGWSKYMMRDKANDEDAPLEMTYEKIKMSNGLECTNIYPNIEPDPSYLNDMGFYIDIK